MSFLCIATENVVQCQIPGAIIGCESSFILSLDFCSFRLPFRGPHGGQFPSQPLGLAASIVVLVMICAISLACSASVRICVCTYSPCNRVTSVRSLACNRDCA